MTVGDPFKAAADGSNQKAEILVGQIQGGTFTSVFPDTFAAAKAKYPAK